MRKYVSSKESDNEQTRYARLTRVMTYLFKIVPYKADRRTSNTDIQPATLLRQKSSDIQKAKPVKYAKEKQDSMELSANKQGMSDLDKTEKKRVSSTDYDEVMSIRSAVHGGFDYLPFTFKSLITQSHNEGYTTLINGKFEIEKSYLTSLLSDFDYFV
ncbi:unnamed protein product [Mytilus coruscus]|uniref:Uncharacterized protein n=1 Tax=Mytilus coruscus TaxID=42192 RepID=A0A6J8AK94_MYTCO|nr:unnamed protein product [Mytilus coruscus]